MAPTVFDTEGRLDLDGQRRCTDFIIDAGADGICILANWSEQFALTDAERETVMHVVLDHVAGRVPVIVTTTHFGSQVCAERSAKAEEAGAAMVMVMPPYHGATLRVPKPAIFDFFRTVAEAVDDPGDDPGRAGGRRRRCRPPSWCAWQRRFRASAISRSRPPRRRRNCAR